MLKRKPKCKRVYVLGAGPAGLLAAHAAAEAGIEVTVFSSPDDLGRPKKSELYGCQYLHRPIPNITEKDGVPVTYQVIGDAVDYGIKVYGTDWRGHTSADEYGPSISHEAWDLRAAYDKLWEMYRASIVPTMLSAVNAAVFVKDPHAYTVSTIPKSVLCRNYGHKFLTQNVWAMGSAPDARLPYTAPDFTVQCNGTADTGWYRAATVFGHSTVEWPWAKKPPLAGVAAVRKPLSNDCTCVTDGGKTMLRGRYGRWQKGVLVDTAYYDTLQVLR